MLTTSYPEVLTAQLLFLALLPFVLFAAPRWAILAWLVMGNLDTTGGGTAVAESFGWMNASKGFILPLYLWWRLRNVPGESLSTVPARLWLLLAFYAGLACFWSPFPLAAAKMVGNMLGILLTFAVLERAARKGELSSRMLSLLILASLGLGVLQTLVFKAYGFDGAGRPTRFSSFVTAQQYAAFLVAFLAIVIRHPGFRSFGRILLASALAVALVLNGSRTWFLGAIVVLLIYFWQLHARAFAYSAFSLATVAFGSLLAFNLNPNQGDPFDYASSRLTATMAALMTGEDTPERSGLANLNFRFSVYDGAISELSSASVVELLGGHGTSSGGNVVMRVFPKSYPLEHLDPNRVVHNEWLRALYEWGVLGFSLLLGAVATLSVGLLRRSKIPATKFATMAALSFLPAFVLALSTENVIAGAGNAVTMGLALLISLSWSPQPARSPRPNALYAPSSAH